MTLHPTLTLEMREFMQEVERTMTDAQIRDAMASSWEGVPPMTGQERDRCQELAGILLEKGGWTGDKIDWFESIIRSVPDDPFTLHDLMGLQEAREREENLRRAKVAPYEL